MNSQIGQIWTQRSQHHVITIIIVKSTHTCCRSHSFLLSQALRLKNFHLVTWIIGCTCCRSAWLGCFCPKIQLKFCNICCLLSRSSVFKRVIWNQIANNKSLILFFLNWICFRRIITFMLSLPYWSVSRWRTKMISYS